jgi:SPP1 gp7 family putative phage head morphogenesis protein
MTKPHPLRKVLDRMRDPSQVGKIRVSYGDDLDRLFIHFKKDLHEKLGVRELAEPSALTPVLGTYVARSITATITIPGKRVVKSNVEKGYTTGGIRGSQYLSALGLQVSYSRTPADAKVIEILVDRNISDLDGITAKMSSDIMRTISDGVLDGKGVEDIAKAIDETIDGIGRDRARMLARTETMTAFNRAATTQYEKVGVAEVEWYTSHLENVCDLCDSYDKEHFSLGEAPPCPAHPNCPCILLPVIETGVRG